MSDNPERAYVVTATQLDEIEERFNEMHVMRYAYFGVGVAWGLGIAWIIRALP